MMKKLISVIILASGLCFASSAQQAFKSLSIGFEAGTTGIGVELAIPIVTDHLVLTGGLTAPSFSYPLSFSMDMTAANNAIDDANIRLAEAGVPERLNTRFSDAVIEANPVINLSSAKLMLEYYPFKKSSFHFTAGAFMGMGERFLYSDIYVDDNTFSNIKQLDGEMQAIQQKYGEHAEIGEVELPSMRFSAFGETYELQEKSGKLGMEAELAIAKIRPYFGLGFGRSMPKGHLGFQLDLGVWYHGSPSLESSQKVEFDPEATDLTAGIPLLEKYSLAQAILYPSLSLRLIYRIF